MEKYDVTATKQSVHTSGDMTPPAGSGSLSPLVEMLLFCICFEYNTIFSLPINNS